MNLKQFSFQGYTLLATAILGSDKLKAQIILQDFDPDLRLMNWQGFADEEEPIEIDIDGNGIYDIKFDYDWGYFDAGIELYINDCVISVGVEDSGNWSAYNIDFFNTDQLIGESLIWANEGFHILSASSFNDSSSGCNIINNGNGFVNKYLPLKLLIDDNIHYGWVRLSLNTIGHGLYNDCYNSVGSPLTVFSTAYNSIPETSVFCNEELLPENGSTFNVKLFDDLDVEDVSDIAITFYAETPDYSEIRVFLMPTRDDVIGFSLNDAITLDPSRYYSISADLVLPGVVNIFNLPASLLDINGDVFSQGTYYSAFYMKMPMEGASAVLTLSTPMNIIMPMLHTCYFHIETIDLDYLNDAGYFQIYFTQDEDESDIASYGVGVANENNIDWLTSFHDYDAIDLTGIIQFPKTGEAEYTIDLIGLTKDIYGEELIIGASYNPLVFGFGDGYYADLLCYDYDIMDVVFTGRNLLGNILQIQFIDNMLIIKLPKEKVMQQVVMELNSITGQKIISQKLLQETNSVDISAYSTGIYFVSIYYNGYRIASRKICIN